MKTISTNCCNKEMINLGDVSYSDNYTIDCIRLVCGECGKILDIHTYNLDDEELLGEIQNYEKLQGTTIHKELLKEDNDLDNDKHPLRKVD